MSLKRKRLAIVLLCFVAITLGGAVSCCCKAEWRGWLDIFMPASVIIGGAFAYWKYAESVEVRRREAFSRLMDDFRGKAHEKTFYELIEREGEEWYLGDLVFASSEQEKQIDGMLLFFEDVLNLHDDTGLISDFELKRFEYYLDRISDDTEVAKYLIDFKNFCSDEYSVNPLKRVTDYVEKRQRKRKTNTDQSDIKTTFKDDFDVDGVLKAYFLNKNQDHVLTRSAKSVISRMRKVKKLMNGFDVPDGNHKVEEFCKEALSRIKSHSSDDVAASLCSALRHWYRAVTKSEPNF